MPSQRRHPTARCPDCGYLLTGLPQTRQCPECGFAYDSEMIVLYGWGFGHQATLINSRWRSGLVLVAGPAGMLIVFAIMLAWGFRILTSMMTSWQAMMIILPMMVPLCLPTVVTVIPLILRFRQRVQLSREGVAPVHVRLSPQGFAQRDGLRPVKLKPWKGRRVRLVRLDAPPEKCR